MLNSNKCVLSYLNVAYDDGGLGMYNWFDWYGRVLEVREV